MTPRARIFSIIGAVAQAHGLTTDDLLGPCRERHMAHARWIAMSSIRELQTAAGAPLYSTTAIGRMFNRDHTSVIHGLRRVGELGLYRSSTPCYPRAVAACDVVGLM